MGYLTLHSGGRLASLEEVCNVTTPRPSGIWRPIPHEMVVQRITEELQSTSLQVVHQEFGLSHDDARMFGIMELRNGSNRDDFALIAGIRNSHDKSFPIGLACGSRVFVCDNLAFSGEVVIRRKHTTNVMRDLPSLLNRAVYKLTELRQHQASRIDAYKLRQICQAEAHDILIRGMRAGVVAASKLPKVLAEWDEPKHEDFRERTLWSLFNAFTEVMKDYETADLPWRTRGLHGLCDTVANVPCFGNSEITIV